MNKEDKGRTNERYVRISSKDVEVILYSPHKEDSMNSLIKEAKNIILETRKSKINNMVG